MVPFLKPHGEKTMVRIVLTPEWFIGKDILIELFSFLVLIAFVILAYRYYKISGRRKIFYLGTGFGLVALAQLATILTKIPLYYNFGPVTQVGEAIVTNNLASSVDFFYYTGFFFHRFLTLLGFYMIYRLPRPRRSVGDYMAVLYFILISSLLSRDIFYIYHLTALFILILIVEKYSWVYKENKLFNTRVLMVSFGVLALSQLIFVLSDIDVLFAVANTIELVSYSIFLALIIRIWKHGKKKKPYGDNIRYAGNSAGKKRKH